VNETGGRYKSSSPSAAARKAATKLFKKASKGTQSKVTFCLRETTVGSKKKEYHYVATRVKLAKPLVRVINGKEIVNRYKTEVKAVKDHKPAKAAKPAKPAKAAKATKKSKSPKSKAAKKPKATKAAKPAKSSKSPKAKRGKKVKGGDCGCDK
jgi:hypothetical protein